LASGDFRNGSRLCENSDVEDAHRTFVSITLNRKRTALAVTVEVGQERRQFYAFLLAHVFTQPGSKADLKPPMIDVRSSPGSGHSSGRRLRQLCAISRYQIKIRPPTEAASASWVNHPINQGLKRRMSYRASSASVDLDDEAAKAGPGVFGAMAGLPLAPFLSLNPNPPPAPVVLPDRDISLDAPTFFLSVALVGS
jgi:hypothetical protein